jgi:prepilin-type processing-associated H-X9-DG protein
VESRLRNTTMTCPELHALYPSVDRFHRCYSVNDYAITGDAGDYPVNTRTPKTLVAIAQPSKMMFFMDGRYGGPLSPPGTPTSYNNFVSAANVRTEENCLLYVHGGRQNIVFFDGHVESRTKDEIPTNPDDPFWGRLPQ